jgi:coniferyl-aldehyde dehydrogenase
VLTAAVQADFGIRSPQLTEFADLLVLRSQLKQALRRLERWMRPATSGPRCTCCRRVRASSASRWAWWASFPLELPAAAVAGPGHHRAGGGQPCDAQTQRTGAAHAAQLAAAVEQYFAPDEFCVVQGDSYLSSQFAGLHFDHLMFTGSTAVGRRVARPRPCT